MDGPDAPDVPTRARSLKEARGGVLELLLPFDAGQ
jgi:hypothetical protein